MKTISIVLMCIICGTIVFAQSWTDPVTSATIGYDQTYTTASDRNGIHILHHASGTLKYARVNSSGSVIVSDVTVATGIGSYAAVTTHADKIYAVYEKNTDVYIAKSTDGGSNWSSPLSAYERTTSFIGIATTADERGVHVAWAENYETYYVLATVLDPSPTWTHFKEVTDYGSETGRRPSVVTSANEVHVGYEIPSGGAPRTRDFLIAESTPTWENPVNVPYGGGYSDYIKEIVVGSNLHVIHKDVVSFSGSATYSLKHSSRAVNSTSWTSYTIDDQYDTDEKAEVVVLNNGEIHLFYQKRYDDNERVHKKFNGSSWSTITDDIVYSNFHSFSSAGNDIFLIQRDLVYENKVSLRQYDNAPTVPANTAIGAPNQVTVSWSYNPEPDIQHVEVWRKYYRNDFDQEDWTLKATRTTNSWTDNDFQLSGLGDEYTVYYKFRAKDNEDQLSSYSSQISTTAVMVFWKNGNQISQKIPTEFNLEQNYPNPFNPSTTIDYAIPEAGNVTITVFDHLGREVASVINKEQNAGYYSATFDASKLSSGTYFYKISVGKYSATKKMLLLK